MADGVVCKECGASITGEPPSENPAERKVCPRCGSMTREYSLQAEPGHYEVTGASIAAVVITYPEALLTTAQGLIAGGDFSIAVVVAHMACEISAERALSRTFAAKGIEYLGESVGDLLPGYNLANERVRNLYNALTGDQIQKQSFWKAFKESASRRNAAVHKGSIMTKEEAEASYKAASDLVAYLQ